MSPVKDYCLKKKKRQLLGFGANFPGAFSCPLMHSGGCAHIQGVIQACVCMSSLALKAVTVSQSIRKANATFSHLPQPGTPEVPK